jgi:3',5'-cyclic AMP phosphodiesterase CpdA
MQEPIVIPSRSGRSLVVGDLHLDFWEEIGRDPLAEMGPDFLEDLDALVIIGDLSNKPKRRWTRLLDGIGKLIEPARVAIFPGNHDYYQFRLDEEARMAEMAAVAGVHYAQTREIRVGDSRILCATLWTDLRLGGDVEANMIMAGKVMNDYRTIRLDKGATRLLPRHTVAVHAVHRAWIEARLAEPFDGRTIVATHHAPHPEATRFDEAAPCYASDLTEMIGRLQPDRWIFAHVHRDFEAEIGATRISSATVGYPGEGRDPHAAIRAAVIETGLAPEPETVLRDCTP